MIDPIIDMSPEQKAMRVEKMRHELLGFGFSIAKTEWLNFLVTFHRQSVKATSPKRRQRTLEGI